MVRKAILSACVVAVAAFGGASFAEEKAAPTTAPAMAGPTPEQHAEMMKAWEAYAKPGPQHEAMAKMVGEWSVSMEDFSAGGPDPMKFEGESEFEVMMGGRYLVNEYEGMMMGQKFEGMGISSYDNIKKKYIDIWIDNMGTGIMTLEGEENAAGEIVYTGKMTMPGMGDIPSRHVAKHVDDDTHTYTMYITMPGGAEQKMMHMTYKRKK